MKHYATVAMKSGRKVFTSGMHAKYEVSISSLSKMMMKVKVDNTEKQTEQNNEEKMHKILYFFPIRSRSPKIT